jgi:preprotein translocase subunit SecD
MLHFEKWKVLLILFLTLAGVAYALPNALSDTQKSWVQIHVPGWLPSKTVNLGLDLRGGSHLLLEADTKVVIAERVQSMVDAARTELRKQNIGYTDLGAAGNGIVFKLREKAKDRDATYKIVHGLEQKSDVDISSDGTVHVVLTEAGVNDINTQVINQSIEIVRRRIDESGTKEPMIQRQGADRIVVQLPGIDDPEHVKELLGKTAKMSFRLLDENSVDGRAGPGAQKMPMKDKPGMSLVVSKRVMISGDMLVDSQPTFERDAPVVSFRFNSIGSKKFCDVTRDNVGKPFAIVLDDEIISAPVIRDAICGGGGIISGSFSVKEAADLSLLLRAGALPAPLKVVEERSVGPTLGADSVVSGKKACLMALLFVTILSCTVYGLFGIFASLALLINMALIIAVMSILQATLTLPGIAGIVLTIGLAVDANVLVFERIKEELRAGRSILSSLDVGYTRARTTIFDSNMSALIAALILFSFGTGPIKGFAVTMCVGVVTSYFSALMLTRMIIISWVRWKKPKTIAV